MGICKLLVDLFSSKETVARLLDDRTDQSQAISYGPCFFDLGGEPFGCAPVECFAGVDDVVECSDGFFDWGVTIRPVGVDDVDIAELEALESGVGSFDQMLAGETDVVDSVAGGWECGVGATPVDLWSGVRCLFEIIVVEEVMPLWTRRCHCVSSQSA